MRMQGIMLWLVMPMVSGGYADVFGTGTNQFSIEFVEIGAVGNPSDPASPTNDDEPGTRRFGSTDHSYRMGTHEISIDQFTKAWTNDHRIGDGDEDFWGNGVDHSVGPGAPASQVSWFEAARFANWLTSGDAYAGAYEFDTNGVLVAVDRDAAVSAYGTVYVLPSEDEWYKAAYYRPMNDGTYSLFSDGGMIYPQGAPPLGIPDGWNYSPTNNGIGEMWEVGVGGLEQNGTRNMNGNIWEWMESAWDETLDDMQEDRVIRDGSVQDTFFPMLATFRHSGFNPTREHELVGFRVVAIPASQAWLNVAVVGTGSVSVAEGWQAFGTHLSVVATPASEGLFMGWSGDLSGNYLAASTNLIMEGDQSITAIFSEDADDDGLTNSEEGLLGTDPRNSDSDADTMPDDWEVGAGLDPLADDAGWDADLDGLLNLEEYGLGTDPLDSDSDDDAMPDGWEVAFVLDPLATNALADADSDGREDLYEFAMGGDPTHGLDVGAVPFYVVAQEGGTHWLDYIHARRTNATALGLSYDLELTEDPISGTWTKSGYSRMGQTTVSNGFEGVTNRMDEAWVTNLYLRLAIASSNEVVYSAVTEITGLDMWAGGHGLYGPDAAPSADPDVDGLDNQAEFNAGTDPLDPDSDNDGLSDGAEVVTHSTNPLNDDTDGDTFDDGQEVANGGSPLISDLWRLDHIRNNGAEYDLFSSNSVLEISLGQAGFEVTNGTAWLSLQLEESTNLITWTNAGDEVIWSIPVDSSNAFYRVRSGR